MKLFVSDESHVQQRALRNLALHPQCVRSIRRSMQVVTFVGRGTERSQPRGWVFTSSCDSNFGSRKSGLRGYLRAFLWGFTRNFLFCSLSLILMTFPLYSHDIPMAFPRFTTDISVKFPWCSHEWDMVQRLLLLSVVRHIIQRSSQQITAGPRCPCL